MDYSHRDPKQQQQQGGGNSGSDPSSPGFDKIAMATAGVVTALAIYSYLIYARSGQEITWKDFVNK